MFRGGLSVTKRLGILNNKKLYLLKWCSRQLALLCKYIFIGFHSSTCCCCALFLAAVVFLTAAAAFLAAAWPAPLLVGWWMTMLLILWYFRRDVKLKINFHFRSCILKAFLPVEHRSWNRVFKISSKNMLPPGPPPPKNHLEIFRQACFTNETVNKSHGGFF